MTRQSVAEVFQLPPDILHGFAPVLPYHPLWLVVAKNKYPKIVIGYDRFGDGRVGDKTSRCDSICVHTNVTVVPGVGEAPICASFGAACAVDEIRDGRIQRVNPHLAAEYDDMYGVFAGMSKLRILRHPNFWSCVEGQVVDEGWRICDSFISIDLVHDRQVAGAIKVIEEWRKVPPPYSLFGRKGRNCKNFINAVVDGARVEKPLWLGWGRISYPGLYAGIIDIQCGRRYLREGIWGYQPRPVTLAMHMRAMEENCGRVQNYIRPVQECDKGRLPLMIPQGSG
jgi:hypothetical protein